MRNDVKPLVFGAMSVAFMGIFYLINQLTGALFEPYIIFLSPLPSLIYTVKYDTKMGFWVVVCGFLIGFILGNFTSVFYLAAGFLGGYVAAILMKHNKSRRLQLFGLFTVLLIANFLMFFAFANLFGYDFMLEVETMAKMISDMGMVNYAFSYQDLLAIMPVCMVAAIILDSYLTATVSYLLATLILVRLKWYTMPLRQPYKKPHKMVGYGLMVGLLAFIFAMRFRSNMALYATLSCFGMISCVILDYYGFKAFKFLLRRKGKQTMNWLVWVAFILLFPFSFVLFGLFGFLYICSDFFENVLK